MSIHEFYSKLTSTEEKTPLFAALRRLSSQGDTRSLIRYLAATGWPSWDSPGQGPVRQATHHA